MASNAQISANIQPRPKKGPPKQFSANIIQRFGCFRRNAMIVGSRPTKTIGVEMAPIRKIALIGSILTIDVADSNNRSFQYVGI